MHSQPTHFEQSEPHAGMDPAGLAALFDSVGEAYCVCDERWVITACNAVMATHFGLPVDLMIGRTTYEINPRWQESVFFETCQEALRARRPAIRTGYSERVGRWLLMRAYPMADGRGMAVFINDVTDFAEERERLAHAARHDLLTGLPNRQALVADGEEIIKQGRPFSVVFFDLDRFKLVNDTAGHWVGDEVLKVMAARLAAAGGEADRLYRNGGDEFVLLSSAPEALLSARLSLMLAHAATPIKVGGVEFVLGASAGLATFPDDASSLLELVRRADLAMYEAKRERANRLSRYEPRLEHAARRRVALEAGLRHAIESGSFELHYQPKARARTAGLAAAEALVRWRPHPGDTLVQPGEFLPVAESCGLMPALDRWVLDRAVQDAAQLTRLGHAFPIAVNVSGQSLADPSLVARVASLLETYDVAADRIKIELTESAFIKDPVSSAAVLEELAAMGVLISIDDFGVAYSSLSWLDQFPIHTLKIDRQFVHKLRTSTRSWRLVRGLIGLAHSMGLEAVAEGVETDEEWAALIDMDCDIIQGWRYARAMPLQMLVHFAESARLDDQSRAYTDLSRPSPTNR